MRKPDGKIVLLGDMNVGKTSLLQRYMERRFADTVSTVGGAFYLKQWRSYNISIWDTAGREQFHGLGSMYCRGATAVILTYDVSHPQSLLQLEDRFLGLTDTASTDCLFAIVGNKVDLVEGPAAESLEHGQAPGAAGGGGRAPQAPRQVRPEEAVALYKKILKYKMLDEKDVPAAEGCRSARRTPESQGPSGGPQPVTPVPRAGGGGVPSPRLGCAARGPCVDFLAGSCQPEPSAVRGGNALRTWQAPSVP
ncbi:ras-related protein Rab-20 [Suricata suricatta]|uniref:ras-related protein Rab-20 n=1 Tax=Suricata suricatta TaxID=37032 RepID=UPI0011553EBA|nr:ras-related protein Rab-20 [Suricata suricatta]